VETRRTFCRVCHAACPLDADVDVRLDTVLAVRGVADDPVFGGYTCSKGRELPAQLRHPDRLRHPLLRTTTGFEPIDGPSLFDELASRLGPIIDERGPRAVATYTGTGAFQSSTALAVTKAWHRAIGSPSFYTSVTIDQPAKVTAPHRLGAWEAGYHGFADADVVLAIGYNPMVSSYGPPGGVPGTNPFTTLRAARKAGLTLIVVDPRRTELAVQADLFLQIRPGEDASLLAGIIHAVLAEGLHDQAFCAEWVGDLGALRAAVAPFTTAHVAQRCGIRAEEVRRAAQLFGRGSRGTATTGTGPNMAPHSSLTEHLALVLNTICGRVNRAGDRIDAGCFLAPPARRRAQAVPPTDPRTGPPSRIRGLRGYHDELPTAALAEEILMPGPEQVRALIVSGGNPVVAWPDQELTVRALRDLELLVVLDHRMTATARLAHAVVPPRLSLERADVPHVMDRWFPAPYTNYTPAVVAADGDVYAEWEVFWELARRLDAPMQLGGGAVPFDVRPTDDELLDLIYAGSRMPLAEMRRERGVIHPDRALVAEPAEDTSARFTVAPLDVIAELAALRDGADEVRPFRLVSRRLKSVLNSAGTDAARNRAYLHPDDMADLGVAVDDLVTITSARSSIVAPATAAPDVRRGVVSIAHGWDAAPTNRLVSTSEGSDPVTGMPVQSAIPVSITKSCPSTEQGASWSSV